MTNQQYDILVVEDEEVIVEVLTLILKEKGLTIDCAAHPDDALQKLKHSQYKVILSDLILPSKTGFEFTEAIISEYPFCPVILMSGYATLENIVQGFRMGVFDILPKPFDEDELLSVVTRALRLAEKLCRKKDIEKQKQPVQLVNYIQQEAKNLYHLGSHAWAKIEGKDSALLGAGESVSGLIGKVRLIKAPKMRTKILQGNEFARIVTQTGHTHRLWAPLSGEVVETNFTVERNPELVNLDPFRQGWLIRILPYNSTYEIKNLTPHDDA